MPIRNINGVPARQCKLPQHHTHTHIHTVFYASARCRASTVHPHTLNALGSPLFVLSLSFLPHILSFPPPVSDHRCHSFYLICWGRWQIFCYAIIGSLSLRVSYLGAPHSLAGMGKRAYFSWRESKSRKTPGPNCSKQSITLGRAWQAALSPYGPGNVHKIPIMSSGAERTDAHMCHWAGFSFLCRTIRYMAQAITLKSVIFLFLWAS